MQTDLLTFHFAGITGHETSFAQLGLEGCVVVDQGAKGVVVKLGAHGAYFRTADNDQGTVPAIPVEKVVDTVGAGDGFAVGVVSALLEGRDVRHALTRGNRIGALAIQVIGDSEGLPTRAELDKLEQAPATTTVAS